ncbi:MAG: GGDEF domain-containing protein [Desulfobacterales bacterium]|nr:GGDEF domain-containing protein [Desulfobacterales bacterium]
MLFSLKRLFLYLITPSLLILFSLLLLFKWPDIFSNPSGGKEFKALLIILPVLPYVIFVALGIMGSRYNNLGLILSSAVLAISYPAFTTTIFLNTSIPAAIAFLLPLNLTFFTLLVKRRIFTLASLFFTLFLIFQITSVFVLLGKGLSSNTYLSSIVSGFHALQTDISTISGNLTAFFNNQAIWGTSTPVILSFVISILYLSYRFFKNKDIIAVGYIGILLSVFLGITVNQAAAPILFFLSAGILLLITMLEASFSMAYIDELTSLPGRRSLDETMLNLGKKYTIAMFDIDHFKKFNDTYGHDAGDQVLHLTASKLREIFGKKVFRYGGEEFTAVFPRKDVNEVLSKLEKFRKVLAATPFIIRGPKRKTGSSANRSQTKRSGDKNVKITVSIGAAQSDKTLKSPDQVIKAADKMLYKAKKSGRNCVKIT